jgi:hypothetical protein
MKVQTNKINYNNLIIYTITILSMTSIIRSIKINKIIQNLHFQDPLAEKIQLKILKIQMCKNN